MLALNLASVRFLKDDAAGALAPSRAIVRGAIGEYHRDLDFVGAIPAGGVQQPAVKEQYVSPFQPHRESPFN